MVRSYPSRQSLLSQGSTGSSYSSCHDGSRTTASSTHGERPCVKHHRQGSHVHHRRRESAMKLLEYPAVKQRRSATTSVLHDASVARLSEGLTHRPRFEISQGPHRIYASDAIPSTPSTFAKSFPSTGKLSIYHDDSTSDGNMNLCVDSEVLDPHGRQRKLILFHLRMHDLKDRRFTLNRHSRDSGREVCSTSNKAMAARASAGTKSPTHAIQLVLANSTQVTMEQQGSRRSKRYEFNISGTKHEWRRQLDSHGHSEQASYHLVNQKTSESIAHITPKSLTARAAREEGELGSWVPPCTLRITKQSVFQGHADIAESIVATGLIALIDDCIEHTWNNKRRLHLHLPAQDYANHIGPEELIDEIFNRSPQPWCHRRLQLR